jgi:hypothetical protein
MVVALCATLAGEDERDVWADILGADPLDAAGFAAGLLTEPHPLVAAGAGLWVRSAYATNRFHQWRAELPSVIDSGDIPTQEQADDWARQRTLGLIKAFPLEITDEVVLLLASALATKVSWEVPFEVVPAAALHPSPWAERLQRVLQTPRAHAGHGHRQFLVATERAGTVAVHLTGARGGLLVGSVIASDAGRAAGDVLAVAEEIVTAEARAAGSFSHLSLFDLPLGAGEVWSITEEAAQTAAPDGREEQIFSVLPAWSADTDLDLNDDALGFPDAARALAKVLVAGDYDLVARQAATARYSATGFEAAAVTAIGLRMSAVTTRTGIRRTAQVRFGHPFAAVAAAFDGSRIDPRAAPIPTRWNGVPVFSAWVSEPCDAEPSVGS